MENQPLTEMIKKSNVALKALNGFDQEQIDQVVKTIATTTRDNALLLAEEAVKETRMGVVEHKVLKNKGISAGVWATLKGKKSVGIINEDPVRRIIEVAKPKGIIGCITPTTNPTLAVVGNAMAALKGRNTVIISPHPRAVNVTKHTVDLINEALVPLGVPADAIQVVLDPTNEKSQELMSLVDIVVATGGMGIVHAAYSSGKPAYGVGQGNVQVVVADDYNEFDTMADDIITSRYLDAGVQCIGDQVVIVPKTREAEIIESFERKGAYYIKDPAIVAKFRETLFKDGRFAGDLVGKTAQQIAEIIGLEIPKDTRIFLLEVEKYGADELLCGEKMCPVTAKISYDHYEEALDIAEANLNYQGAGHTACVFTDDRERAKLAGIQLPVSRMLVNLPGAAATGSTLTTDIQATSSIGCGSWGNNSISENLTYKHLLDISTIAFEFDEPAPTEAEIYA